MTKKVKTSSLQTNDSIPLNWDHFQSNWNDWNIIETDFISPQLYYDLFHILFEYHILWICHDVKIVKQFFIEEIKEERVFALSEKEELLLLKNPNLDLDNHNKLFFIHCGSIHLKSIIKLFPIWDRIIVEIPESFYSNKNSLIDQLKEFKHVKTNFTILTHNNNCKLLHKICSKLVWIYKYPQDKLLTQINIVSFQEEQKKLVKVIDIINKHNNKGIIFVSRRMEGERLEELLNHLGYPTCYVKSGLDQNSKRYLENRFHCSSYFDSLKILIIHNLTDLNILSVNIGWVIQYNFSSSLENYLKDISFLKWENANLVSYLFYSYKDKIEQKNQIESSCPDSKSIRLVLSTIRKGEKWGKSSFLVEKELYNLLRLSRKKIDSTLSLLEKEDIIQKEMYIITKARYFVDVDFLRDNPLYPKSLNHFLIKNNFSNMTNFMFYCKQENISPFIVTKKLYTLESKQKLYFLFTRTALSFSFQNNETKTLKLKQEEIKRKTGYYEQLNRLTDLEKWIELQGVTEKSLMTPKKFSKNGSNPYSLSQTISLCVLTLIDESSIFLGKNTLADILSGSQSRKIKDMKLNELSLYGSLSLVKTESIKQIIIQLLMESYIEEIDLNQFFLKGLRLSNKGRSWLSQEKNIKLILWKHHQQQFSNIKQSSYPLLKKILSSNLELTLPENIMKAISFLNPKSKEELSMIKGIKSSYIDSLSQVLFDESNIDKNEQNNLNSDIIKKVDHFINIFFPKLEGEFDEGYSLDFYSLTSEGKRKYTDVGRAVHNFKYKNKSNFPNILIDRLLTFLKKEKEWNDIDLILSVPSTDQYPSIAKDLGVWLSEALTIPFKEDLILRNKEIQLQKSLESLEERFNNVNQLFNLTESESITNKKILLLDDIYDSGSTINACTKILKDSNPLKIYVLTCCRTDYRES